MDKCFDISGQGTNIKMIQLKKSGSTHAISSSNAHEIAASGGYIWLESTWLAR